MREFVARFEMDEMPNTCCVCRMKGYNKNVVWNDGGRITQGAYVCVMTGSLIDNTQRPDDCPILCQLPEGHGRLVDANDVNNHIMGYVDLRDCPTIVPAERSET